MSRVRIGEEIHPAVQAATADWADRARVACDRGLDWNR